MSSAISTRIARLRRRALALGTSALIASPFTIACSSDETEEPEAAEEEVEVAEAPKKELFTSPALTFVEKVSPTLRTVLTERAGRDDFQNGLEARLAKARQISEKRKKLPEARRPDKDLHYDETLSEYYGTRQYQPVLTRRGRLSDAGEAIFEVIKAAEDHSLDPSDYWVEKLDELVKRAHKLSTRLEAAPGLDLNQREQLFLATWIEVNEFDFRADDATERLTDLLVSTGEDNPVPRVRGAYDLYRSKQTELLEVAVELEIRFADSYLRYARDMNLGNLNRLSEAERKKYGDDPHPKYHSEIVLARFAASLDEVGKLESTDAGKSHIEGLWPQHEQYAKLRDARNRYREIVEAGGWPTIEPVQLTRGGRAPAVQLLKQRLTAEGYYEGVVDDFYDDPLADAIAAYQETHQMEITGDPAPVFWRSLNISAENRLKEIEINLERWRNSRMVKSNYYVYINVPDFHMELWRQGERKARHKIVVGSTRRECNSKGQWEYPNQTPLQHAKLDHLIFNPYWNVPPRIEREEYAPEISKDKKWLEKNNFEYHQDRAGGVVLRQMPGPDNALGKVKFIFPNKHNTYMHDTPKPEFFEYPVRAFSHGCMRLEDPMELAEVILDTEGKWDDKRIWGYLKQRGEQRIDLEQPIDVFIEYFTVRVDEFGRLHFLADIYKHVRNEIAPASRCSAGSTDSDSVPTGAEFGP